MKTKLLSILAISVFFVFAACDDDDDSNNTNNVNNTNNTNNTNNAECGNGIIETGEVCDGTALDGEDCTTVGDYTGGTLACANDCLGYDETNCTADTNNINNAECGNGVVETGEVCDGTNLDGEDCTTIGAGYTGGELACASDCLSFDEAACTGDATPTPDGFVGSSCADVADCTEVEDATGLTAECVENYSGMLEFPGGYCTSVCDTATEPDPCLVAGGECVSIMNGMVIYCLQPCVEGNNDCRTGYNCAAASQEEGAPTYCLPPFK